MKTNELDKLKKQQFENSFLKTVTLPDGSKLDVVFPEDEMYSPSIDKERPYIPEQSYGYGSSYGDFDGGVKEYLMGDKLKYGVPASETITLYYKPGDRGSGITINRSNLPEDAVMAVYLPSKNYNIDSELSQDKAGNQCVFVGLTDDMLDILDDRGIDMYGVNTLHSDRVRFDDCAWVIKDEFEWLDEEEIEDGDVPEFDFEEYEEEPAKRSNIKNKALLALLVSVISFLN